MDNGAVFNAVADNDGASGEKRHPGQSAQPACAVAEKISSFGGRTFSLAIDQLLWEMNFGSTYVPPIGIGHQQSGKYSTGQLLRHYLPFRKTHEELSSARLRYTKVIAVMENINVQNKPPVPPL